MNYKLSKTISNTTLLVAIVSVVTLSLAWIIYEYDDFKNEEQRIKTEFLTNERNRIKTEVNRAISILEYNYSQRIDRIKKNVKQRINEAYTLIDSIYKTNKNQLTNEEIINLIKETLRNQRFFDGLGYYFIYDLSGKTILLPTKPEYENSNKLHNFKDLNGKYVIKDMIKLVNEEKEGFIDWTFYRPDNLKEQGAKKGYVKLYEPLGIFVATADYIFSVEEALKEESIQRIRNITYSKDGYIFVLDKNGTILVNKEFIQFENKNISQINNKKIQETLLKIVNRSKEEKEFFFEYNIKKPSLALDIDKLSYIKTYEKWGWLIGTGVYLDKVEKIIQEEKLILERKVLERIFYTIILMSVILTLIIISTRIISRRLDKNFSLFVTFFRELNNKNKKIDTKHINFYEFHELADYANNMLENKIKNEREIANKNRELLENLNLLNEYKRAVDESNIVSKSNPKGIITYVNEAFCNVSGFKRDELIGQYHNIIKHPDNDKLLYKDLWKTIKSKKIWIGVIKNKNKNGNEYYVKSTIVPILDVVGDIKEFIAIRSDVTDLIQQAKRIRLQTTDNLTQLPNREKLIEDLNNKFDLKLVIFNIERFKEINEYYGFEIGDKVLIEVTNLLKEKLKHKKEFLKLYKLPGDEFAILGNNSLPKNEFKKICEELLNIFKMHEFNVENNTFHIHMVAGASLQKNYFINAEMATNYAKEEKKELVFFDDNISIKDKLIHNINWTQKLKEAFKDDRVVVFAQPIISNTDPEIKKYECLVRMIDVDGKVISPFMFLDIAKKSKLYNKVTQTVILKAFEYFSKIDAEFSINLTIEDILDENTIELLKSQIAKYEGIGKRVVLEIVEDEGIENYDKVSEFLTQAKEMGCKIAIDDFGTGYSNFDYLMKLNADFIKIDGSIIKNINTDKNAKIVTELIVRFAKQLNIKTIGEFVASKEILDTVKDMNIDFSQGYYLGEPKEIK